MTQPSLFDAQVTSPLKRDGIGLGKPAISCSISQLTDAVAIERSPSRFVQRDICLSRHGGNAESQEAHEYIQARIDPKPCPTPSLQGDCWVWKRRQDSRGYGWVTFHAMNMLAHRFTYKVYCGEIPLGLDIDHLCRVRMCVNPDHLEAVTHRVNLLRGENFVAKHAAKTHCIHGHQFSVVNTRVNKDGERKCRRCDARRQLEMRRRRAAAVLVVKR